MLKDSLARNYSKKQRKTTKEKLVKGIKILLKKKKRVNMVGDDVKMSQKMEDKD